MEQQIKKLIEQNRDDLIAWATDNFNDGSWRRGFIRGIEHVTSDIESSLWQLGEEGKLVFVEEKREAC